MLGADEAHLRRIHIRIFVVESEIANDRPKKFAVLNISHIAPFSLPIALYHI